MSNRTIRMSYYLGTYIYTQYTLIYNLEWYNIDGMTNNLDITE